MNEKEKNRIMQIIKNVFSIYFIKSIVYSISYYIYEHVEWRRYVNAKDNIRVHPTASLRYGENIYIGMNSHINMNCCIWAGKYSKIVLGDNLLMGPGVSVQSTNHGTLKDKIMMLQEEFEKDIVIGDDCWLCSNVTVLSGVNIADGCIVAAGAVVTKSVYEPYAIIAGVPAKVIGYRKTEIMEKLNG